jgi:TonB family protein
MNPCERLARAWVRQAARRSPPALAERLEEEWQADLAEQRGALAQLRFAAGCWWAKSVIAHEQLALRVSATGPAATPTLGSGSLSPRTLFIGLIIAVHGLVIYGFTSGLGRGPISTVAGPTVARWIDEVPPQDRTPLAQPQTPLSNWRIDDKFPDPHLNPQFPSDSAGTGASVVDGSAAADSDLSPPHPQSVRVSGGPGPGFPSTEDFYPSVSRRLAEVGVATVSVCVNAQGRLASAPTLVESSGSSRLDAGALQLATAASGHYRSSTEDGRPVTDCFPFRIRFALK